jgi:amino acid adenylation domain-containing protein
VTIPVTRIAAHAEVTQSVDGAGAQTPATQDNTASSEQGPAAGYVGLASLFEAQVKLRPDAIAVSCGDAHLSYAELDRRANRIAHHLLGRGVGRESVVGLCLSRSLELIVGMLGIVKSGAAYLPLDLVYPKERLAFMLEDAGAAVVLTLSGDRDAIPQTADRVVCLDTDWERIAGESETPPAIDHSSDALAYVIYTSGSTGKPKGCQVTRGNVAWFLAAIDQTYDFTHDDVWTFFQSHAFDMSVLEIWGALTHGARLVVVPHVTTRSPEAFRKLLLDERVTVVNHTPTAFLQLMRVDEAAATPADYALRYLFLGGEALELQALRPWFQRYGDQRPCLVNMYGPTETTVYVSSRVITQGDLDRGAGSVIGVALPDAILRVLDDNLQPLGMGEVGELFIGGPGVTLGYLKRPELTTQRFIEWRNPRQPDAPAQRLYRSGDLAREIPTGDLEYLGRIDHQVKIRGYRIELGEIEAALTRHPAVRACAVVAREDRPGDKRLVAYVVPNGQLPSIGVLRAHLATGLPEYMVPSAFVRMEQLPQTENGKLDRRALPPPDRRRPELSTAHEQARTPVERRLCEAFSDLLDVDGIGRHDNFFELGGNSLLAMRLLERVRKEKVAADGPAPAAEIPATILFAYPTPATLASALAGDADDAPERARLPRSHRADASVRDAEDPIAIVAMAGRFPGADDVEAFWNNLCEGRDSITMFGPDELDPAVSPVERDDPAYVPARGVINGVEQFDAAFFGIGPREAELMDPQQRIFLELSWECLERGGHVPDATGMPVGVFAGMYNGTYFQRHLMPRPDLINRIGAYAVTFLNEKDYIATRVAHKLNLTGPAISVHTACSTSLVAICQAVDSLRAGHCDMALAGGASVTCPPRSGYLYEEGAMFSPDGHTRTFDAGASGTVFSDGAMVVLLKRLSDARADGNPVYAVIRGGAVNNDGGAKASFTAPNSDGQAAVIVMAHRNAGVDPRSISYVEAHGTGTPMGDPIEIEGLTKAFRRGTADVGFCRIGSVKSNVGHLVIAAGGAGLIKTALALAEEKIPATLHFESPNPTIDFANSPFVVNHTLSDWRSDGAPRRAGVTSLGVGGTNAHVVLEEAPETPRSDPADGPQLLVLSARTPAALGAACVNLAAHLEGAMPPENLADVAWTLAIGRKAFAHRIALVANDVGSAIAALRSPETATAAAHTRPVQQSDVVFMFPGQGATYPGMGRTLYDHEPAFRAAVDECTELLREPLGFDLRDRLFDDDPEALLPTSIMQPATFVLEYSLARLWMSHGVVPAAMIGHSVGEFVAATLAGVFGLPHALRLVSRRGALMQAQPGGAMLSVRLGLDAVLNCLPAGVSLAAENAPGACVVAGPTEAVEQLRLRLESEGVACRALRTSHAFHSDMMEPVVAPFLAEVGALPLSAPSVPLVSTATGAWLDAAAAVSPEYWARHLREPVRFAAALGRLIEGPGRVLLEVGPRATLRALARQHPSVQQHDVPAVASLADAPASELASLRLAAGRLWSHGVSIDPAMFDRRRARLRVRLPTYPFERQRYWIDAPAVPRSAVAHAAAGKQADRDVAVAGSLQEATAPGPSMPVVAPDRRTRLVAQLKAMIEDFAGFAIGDGDVATNFMALGLDSLMLTQAAVHLQKTFAIKITFRQLMGEYATLGQLAQMLDAQLPPDAPPLPMAASASDPKSMEPPLPVVPVPAASAPSVDADYLRRLIAQQTKLMASHLALLDNASIAQAPQVGDEAAPAVVDPVLTQEASDVTQALASGVESPPDSAPERALMDAACPIVPGAMLGREPDGRPAWFVADPARAAGFLKVTSLDHADAFLQEPVDYDPFAGGALSLVVPTTEAQREIWLADQLGHDASLAFNLSVSLRLRGPLDAAALQGALQKLVDRHDALRASVGPDGETFCVRGQFAIPLPTTDLTALDDSAAALAIDQRVRHAVESPFAIGVEPLLRAELLRQAADAHVLLLTAHHIVCDGWSWWMIVHELSVLYGQGRGLSQAALPPPASFADYALAEFSRRRSAAHAADEAYWQSRFSGDVPVLDLATDRPRPAQRSFASAREDHVIDASVLDAVRGLGAQRGASLFSTLLAGLSGLLCRLSGQSSVVVGIPAAGQPLDGFDELVGHCVNLLPLRFELDLSQPFARAVDAAQAELLDAMEHQRFTFGTLLKTLRITRNPSRMPLVNVLFNLEQALDRDGDAFPGLSLECDSNPRSFETFELFVNAVQTQGSLRLECQYNRDLYDAATVRGWLRAFETLLRSAVDGQAVALGDLPLVDAAMQAELASLQPAPVVFDRECRMHEHFEAQCDRTPDRIALRCGPVVVSYADLEQRANRIAHLLRGQGVMRGSLVGLALDRGVDMVAGLLGILKAGAGYVPLDPQFPRDRLAYMAADAGLAVLLTTHPYAAQFDLRGRPILELDGLATELAAAACGRIGRDDLSGQAEGVAYVIYTSGSTGRPKGVKVPHRAVANFLSSMREEPGLSADDRFVAVTTLSFDIAVLELLLPLSVGAEVVIADRETAGDGVALRSLLESSRATAMQATPSTWRLLVDAQWAGSPTFKALCGGEAMAPDLAVQLLPRCGALWNLYGPTETTVWSTCARIAAAAESRIPDISIGRPIANTRVWIVDPRGQLCPRGVAGEICIAGEGVTLGYLDRPELTAERFVADAFAPPGAGSPDPLPLLYRTGDLGRWRPDRNLEHLGRLDHQVKVRGYRIELGEIEVTLAAREDIARALVIVREDQPNDQRLVAYVMAAPGAHLDEATVRAQLRDVLPAYMVPQHIVALDALPLLPNGKVDRHALPRPLSAPGLVEAGVATQPEKALDPRVRYLIDVWSELLGTRAGPDDNFFDLGGHSMRAVQMANRVARDTGVRIKLIRLGAETLARIAADLPDAAPSQVAAPGVGGRIGSGLRRLLGLPGAPT